MYHWPVFNDAPTHMPFYHYFAKLTKPCIWLTPLVASVLLTSCSLEAKEDAKLATPAKTGDVRSLTIKFVGVESTEGNINLAIFDNKESYQNLTKPVASISLPAGNVSITLHDFPSGAVAISAYHDKNNNQDLDMAGGYPAEGYSVSGASSRFDEPTFDAAKVLVENVEMTMYYIQ